MATIKREGNKVYIQTADKPRKVGEIVGEGENRILLVYRTESRHLMRVWDAYGFSKQVMDHKDWFDYVQLEETDGGGRKHTYLLPRQDLVLHGKEYETDTFERQYFVTRDKLRQYEVK